MITWIQKYFQRHFRTVFAVMLALMIISLVGFYNASGGFSRGGNRERASQPFFGLDLANPEVNQRVFGDAEISRTLHLASDIQTENYAQLRQASLWLADQFHLPAPGKTDLDAFLQSLPYFANPETHQFDPSRYNTLLDNLATNPKTNRDDLARILVDDVRSSEVERLLAGPGFLLPSEARAILDLDESSWTLAVATVDYASFAPTIPPPSAAGLEKYFDDNAARFSIPPQVRVDAIEFPTGAFLPKVSVTDKEVRDFYDTDPTAFTKPVDTSAVPPLLAKPDDKPEDKAAKADADFAAARPKVEEALRLDRARRLAEGAAADLSVALFEQKPNAASLAPFLAARTLTLKPLAPFASDATPDELGSPSNTAAAFKLTAEQPFSDALPTSHGAVVLVWRENIPARQPAYAEVRDRVAAAWQADEKHRLFAELGRSLHTRLEAALKAGTPFEQAVTAAATGASSAKLEVKSYTGFTLAQKREAGSFDPVAPLLEKLETLQKGQVTDMVTVTSETDRSIPEKGLIAYAVDKKLPDPATPESKAMLRQLTARVAAYAANESLAELVQHEIPKTGTQP